MRASQPDPCPRSDTAVSILEQRKWKLREVLLLRLHSCQLASCELPEVHILGLPGQCTFCDTSVTLCAPGEPT